LSGLAQAEPRYVNGGHDLSLANPVMASVASLARSLVSIEDVGVATAFLAHDAARLITGETLYVDAGYHIMD